MDAIILLTYLRSILTVTQIYHNSASDFIGLTPGVCLSILLFTSKTCYIRWEPLNQHHQNKQEWANHLFHHSMKNVSHLQSKLKNGSSFKKIFCIFSICNFYQFCVFQKYPVRTLHSSRTRSNTAGNTHGHTGVY